MSLLESLGHLGILLTIEAVVCALLVFVAYLEEKRAFLESWMCSNTVVLEPCVGRCLLGRSQNVAII